MATKVRKSIDIGVLVRDMRKSMGLDQAKAAGLCGVGVRFLSDLERGKETVSLAKVLLVVQRLGLELWLAPKGRQRLESVET